MKKIVFSLFLILGFLLSVEILSVAFLYFFYSYPPYDYRGVTDDIKSQITQVTYANFWLEYPYLGYRNTRTMQGLDQILSQKKSPSEYWVGLFGGSLAEMFALDGPTMKTFEQLLSTLPQTKNKKVRFINLTMGGFRQPQQLIAFSVFGNRLDMAINIEGVNEVSDFLLNGSVPLDFPSISYRYYYFGKGMIYLRSSRWVAELVEKMYFSEAYQPYHFASAGLALGARTLNLSLAGLYHLLSNRFTHLLCQDTPCYPRPPSESLRLVQLWENSVRDQYVVSRLAKIPLFVFIQPSQYVENSKIFSAWEKQNVLDDVRFEQLGPRYQLLLEKSRQLRREGFQVHDLVDIFKDRKDSIYSDSCCHINSIGNQLMSQAIFETIRNSRPKKETAGGKKMPREHLSKNSL